MKLQYFASELTKHYLTKDTQLEMVACVECVSDPCPKLTDIGLDYMEGLYRNTLEQLVEKAKFLLVDSIGRTEGI